MLRIPENKKLQLGVILVLTLLAYGNIFRNAFVWDDQEFIAEWPAIRSWNNLPQLLSGDLPARHGGVYRPVRSVVYLAARSLLGENVFGYHIHSLVVHLLAAALVYLITLKITKKSLLAFFTALLFGLHPVHTEAVTYMTTNFDLWGVVFLLASFYGYIHYTETTRKFWYAASLALAGFAIFTYEIALVVPLILLAYEFLWRKNFWKKFLPMLIPYFAVSAAYFVITLLVVSIPARSAPLLGGSVATHALTIIKILARYMVITVFPINLTVYPQILESSVLVAALVVAAALALAIVSYRKKNAVIPFAIAWFSFSLLPVLQIVPSKIVMAERYLYLASFGFCLLVGWMLYALEKNQQRAAGWLAGVILVATTGWYFFTTINRNQDWKDEATLWAKTAAQAPLDARAQHNLGTVYFRQGNFPLALTTLQKAIALDPNYTEAYSSLGLALEATEQHDQAIAAYQKALALEPRYLDAIRNLGDVYLAQEKFTSAIQQYDAYLQYDENADVYNNKAVALLNNNQLDAAERNFQKALELNPDFMSAKLGLAITLIAKKEYVRAKELLQEILAIDPNNTIAQEKMLLLDELINSDK